MDAPTYVRILDTVLLPKIDELIPNGQCLIQDNYPKHTSSLAKVFLEITKFTGGLLQQSHQIVTP